MAPSEWNALTATGGGGSREGHNISIATGWTAAALGVEMLSRTLKTAHHPHVASH